MIRAPSFLRWEGFRITGGLADSIPLIGGTPGMFLCQTNVFFWLVKWFNNSSTLRFMFFRQVEEAVGVPRSPSYFGISYSRIGGSEEVFRGPTTTCGPGAGPRGNA